MIWLAYVLWSLIVYYVWAYVHEYSHLLMVERFTKVNNYQMQLYPHMHNGSWFFARVTYNMERALERNEQAWVSIAPRFAGALALVALPVVHNYVGNMFLTMFVAGGVVDWAVGFVGRSHMSDLQRFSRDAGSNGVSLNLLRILGFLFVGVSLLRTFIP